MSFRVSLTVKNVDKQVIHPIQELKLLMDDLYVTLYYLLSHEGKTKNTSQHNS